MRRLRGWLVRLAGLFNKPRKDRELDAEIEGHLQMHVEDNLRLGATREQARRQGTRDRFGRFLFPVEVRPIRAQLFQRRDLQGALPATILS